LSPAWNHAEAQGNLRVEADHRIELDNVLAPAIQQIAEWLFVCARRDSTLTAEELEHVRTKIQSSTFA
jgi:hypothetical protein